MIPQDPFVKSRILTREEVGRRSKGAVLASLSTRYGRHVKIDVQPGRVYPGVYSPVHHPGYIARYTILGISSLAPLGVPSLKAPLGVPSLKAPLVFPVFKAPLVFPVFKAPLGVSVLLTPLGVSVLLTPLGICLSQHRWVYACLNTAGCTSTRHTAGCTSTRHTAGCPKEARGAPTGVSQRDERRISQFLTVMTRRGEYHSFNSFD